MEVYSRSKLKPTKPKMAKDPKGYSRRKRESSPVAAPRSKIPKLSRCDQNTAARTQLATLSIKSVLLYDWWLARADGGEGLAVGGFTMRERLGIRDFRSAAIVKRLDTTIIESKDGISITISGLINRSRTLQNGFPVEICSRFRLGFPCGWEKYATLCPGDESAKRGVLMGNSGYVGDKKSSGTGKDAVLSPVSLEDLPVTRIRDTLMFTLGSFGDFDPDEVLQSFCGTFFKDTPVSSRPDKENKSPSKTANHTANLTPLNQKLSKADLKSGDANEISGTVASTMEEHIHPDSGVTTRSMSKLRNRRGKPEDLNSNSAILCKSSQTKRHPKLNSATITEDDISLSASSEEVTTNARKVSPATISSKETREVPNVSPARRSKEASEVPNRSPARRSSSRLKIRKDYREDAL